MREDSLTDILNHYDNSVKLDSPSSPQDPSEVLWNDNKGGGIKNKRQVQVDITTSINNNNVSPKALPYYENDDNDDIGDVYSSFGGDNNRNMINNDEQINKQLLRFDVARDWLILILSSMIYSATIIDYKHYSSTKDLIYGAILMFWLGFCCGWLFRLTKSCFISAIFNSLIIFNFKYVFNQPDDFCNGAC